MRAVKPLAQVQLGVALADIYAGPTGATAPFTARLGSLWLCNVDSSVRTCTVRFGTGTLTVANSLAEGWSIPAGTTFVIVFDNDEGLSLPLGYKLQGLCSVASTITATLFGSEES